MDNNILPENEFTTVEGRAYLNPNLQVDETNTFIDNLRNTQQADTAQITMDTRNLGTQIPSNLGGLVGGTGYFTSRYQTPQTNLATQNLRTAAQAAALSQALANEEAAWKKRYQDAYRNYQRREYNRSRSGYSGGGGGGGTLPTTTTEEPQPDISENETVVEIGKIAPEGIAQSRYNKLLMKYLQAGYPREEAESHAKEDWGKSISVDAPVAPYNGGK